MAMLYVVREITRDGQPTGKFHMTANSDEDPNGLILGLCEHEHDTRGEALACPVVAKKLARIYPAMLECPECGELKKALRAMINLYDVGDSHNDLVVDAARKALDGDKR